MAFNDSLIVDDSAKASEDSFLTTMSFFKMANGFLSRKPIPDYGVDLEVELLLEGKNVSGGQFPIQIKSQQNLSVVLHGGEQFVSHALQTSRLGYLCKRGPAYGLVVLYDDKTGILYFDYVEEIVKRTTNQHNGEDWKDQGSVNINIPTKNILTLEELKKIHVFFYQRFLNNQQLLTTYGDRFDIPVLVPSSERGEEDLSSPEKIVEFINKYGVDLYNRQDFLLAENLLSKLSFTQIIESPKTLYVAAITYESIGKFIDADYFITKSLQQIEKYSIGEQQLINVAKLKVDFVLGRISINEYRLNLERTLSSVTEETTQIYIKIRLVYLKLGEMKTNKNAYAIKAKEIDELLGLIDKSTISAEAKYYYRVFLAGAWHTMLILVLTRAIGLLKIKEKMLGNASVEDRQSLTKLLLPEFTKANDIYKEAFNFAVSVNNDLLKSYTINVRGSSFFQLISNVVIRKFINSFFTIDQCTVEFNFLLIAYNYFIKNGLWEYAYQAITTANDINKVCVLFFKKEIEGANENEILKRINGIIKQTGRKPYESPIETIENALKTEDQDPRTIILEMTDVEVEDAADIMVEARGLPLERRANILAELKFMKEAYTELKGMNFNVLQNLDHTKSIETMYRDPLLYRLECSKCGFYTSPGKDLSQLLSERKARHEHVCL